GITSSGPNANVSPMLPVYSVTYLPGCSHLLLDRRGCGCADEQCPCLRPRKFPPAPRKAEYKKTQQRAHGKGTTRDDQCRDCARETHGLRDRAGSGYDYECDRAAPQCKPARPQSDKGKCATTKAKGPTDLTTRIERCYHAIVNGRVVPPIR